ncbi:MAG: dihydrofolate reductase family protein [Aestuariivirga sp.]
MTQKVILQISISLDGFVGAPNGNLDWMFPNLNAQSEAFVVETLWGAGVHIMGSETFRGMVSHWPVSHQSFAAPMNEISKAVASSNPAMPEAATAAAMEQAGVKKGGAGSEIYASWRSATVMSGDLGKDIARLKKNDQGYVLAHGGARFVRSLLALNLVDELRLLMHPVILGKGLPIFDGVEGPRDLTLLDVKVFETGTTAKTFVRPN